MNGLSIIIATFGVCNYLDECIKSIMEQDVDYDFEILLGIDNCKDTLNHISGNSLYENVRVFFFEENNGPFVVKNNLVSESKYENILFFDSDDILCNGSLNKLNLNTLPDMILFRFKDFFNDDISNCSKFIKTAHGVLFIKKSIFLSLNGFENWRCGADTEFIKRFHWNGLKYTKIYNPFFMRRIHTKNLTVSEETKFGSSIRKYAADKINEKYSKKNWPNPELVKKSYRSL